MVFERAMVDVEGLTDEEFSCWFATFSQQAKGVGSRPVRLNHCIRGRIPDRLEPRLAARAMVPPLFLRPGLVLFRVQVLRPFVYWSGHRRSIVHFPAEPELVDAARAAVRTGDKE